MAVERRQFMLDYVWKHGELLTNQAMELFSASAPTIRRDFNKLVQSHPALTRTHGGIHIRIQDTDKEFEFDIKQNLNTQSKQEIAAKACRLIQPHDCIFLDSGSTCFELAKYLRSIPLTVVTTDVKIADLLGGARDIDLYIVGGKVRTGFFSIGDTMACDMLQQFSATLGFMSCDAVSLDAGVTNSSMFEVSVKRALMKQSKAVCMLVDEQKLETTAPYAVASLSVIKYLVTTSNADVDLLNKYRARGIEVL
ncbi:DeoR/GlpR family DNA-binding transcription regulator [Vibrio panuliri]|uniref:HTH deoR-type domain-containing protein n=1 Tax=Vibrio panuliri TaxID=1381081 RepID=A0A1Q9HQM2_9VIBR|nr:DeoR/GlpR family DNA-binding transcription regulator [Vibrio panuliri]KAB1458048.1 DeoR/GlpR transcriptional regulator [Vibrio panuliri]OLQ93167.1 hypothetical protein BIY22_01365 [Vibrio panuliri]OLQ95091.1 hypothetical protein BIY20_07020 [Vibrio panuliri]